MPQFFQKLDSVHTRKPKIHHQTVDTRVCPVDIGLAGQERRDTITFRSKREFEGVHDRTIIIHHCDKRLARHAGGYVAERGGTG
jgi:hypothetical protein